jgi:hypothetical protein
LRHPNAQRIVVPNVRALMSQRGLNCAIVEPLRKLR